MRKLLIATLTLILVACCSVLTACSLVEGTYKFESLSFEEGGVSINVEAGEEFLGETISEDFMVIEIGKDGKCTVTMDGDSIEATWEKDGDVIKITIDGDTAEFKIDGNKLIFEMSGVKYTLKKQ